MSAIEPDARLSISFWTRINTDKRRSVLLTYKSLPFSQEIFVLLVFLVPWWCHLKTLPPRHQERQGHQADWLRLCRSRIIRVYLCPKRKLKASAGALMVPLKEDSIFTATTLLK
jgi:hypothetical protein